MEMGDWHVAAHGVATKSQYGHILSRRRATVTRMAAVIVRNLWKVYTRPKKRPGLRGALRHIVRPEVERIEALKGVSFAVEQGEILGYIGPNGAGKTTTLKILSGVIYPTKGECLVLGFRPHRRERAFLKQITLVMSGRGFLEEIAWDLSVVDGLRFVQRLYRIPDRQARKMEEEIVDLLELRDLLHVRLRQLSHGQRARVELAAALLWQPKVLFLDEPTLGLDVAAQDAIRRFIRHYVRTYGATCIVTSHYTRDIEELADRVILIDRGTVVAEGSPRGLARQLVTHRVIRVALDGAVDISELRRLPGVMGAAWEDHGIVRLEVHPDEARLVLRALVSRWDVRDLSLEEPSLEQGLREYFKNR